MKFGMNLLLWAIDFPDSIGPILEKIKNTGYDGVELPIFDLNPELWAAAGKKLDDLGLERTAVTVRGSDDNPISPDPKIRRASVEANKLTVDCVKAAGASLLVGPIYAALGEFSGNPPSQEEWNWGVESIREVSEYAGSCGVTLGLEPINRFEIYLLNTTQDARRFIEDVNHPACKMMIDAHHIHLEEKSVTKAIETSGDLLAHVHISENDRSTPGSGNVSWDEVFDTLKAINYDGWLTIEAFSGGFKELVAATKIWRKMFESEEQLIRDGLSFMKSEYAKRWNS